MDPFTRAYLDAAAWTTDPDPGQGEYQAPAIDELDPAFVRQAEIDCAEFRAEWAEVIAGAEDRAGSDFWLTRNRHGSGFWDGGWGDDGSVLTDAAHAYGEVDESPWADGRW